MKRIITLGAVVLVLVVVYTAGWFWAAGQITAYTKGLETADGTSLPRVHCGALAVGGFPFGFDVTCDKATIEMEDVTVGAAGLKASVQVYNPFHVIAFAQSPVTVADAFTGSQSRVDFTSAEASARLSGWRIGRVSVLVEAPVWNDTILEDRLIASASHAELHLVDLPDRHDAEKGLAALGEYALVEGLTAPGFDIAQGKATFEGELDNIPDDLRTYGDADLVKRWQAAGGQFKLIGFKGEAGSDRFEATGNLALDTQGRVDGQLKLSSKGVVERLGPSIPEQVRGLVVGAQAADGSYSQTLNIAAGVVFAGVVPAAMIPPLY